MERVEAAMREEVRRIAEGHATDLDALDHHISTMTDVMARCREACVAIIDLRQKAVSK